MSHLIYMCLDLFPDYKTTTKDQHKFLEEPYKISVSKPLSPHQPTDET